MNIHAQTDKTAQPTRTEFVLTVASSLFRFVNGASSWKYKYVKKTDPPMNPAAPIMYAGIPDDDGGLLGLPLLAGL